MRHFLSLVLALVLAPVIWVALAFGLDRTIRATGTFASATNHNRLLGAGLLLVVGLAVGVLLGTRLSPVGPALAGLVFLAASGLALSPTSPIFDWGRGQLSPSHHSTLIVPLQSGLFWALGLALLVPLVVPSRWRRRPAAATVTPPGAPNVPANLPYGGPAPGAAGPAQSGAPGWSANPPQGGGPTPAGTAPSSGAGAAAGQYDQGRPYQGAGSGGYRSEAGDAPSVPSWDTPPSGPTPEQGYPAGSAPEAYPPSSYQPTSGYSPSDYSATPYSGAYPGSEPASGSPAYPASNYPPTGYPPATYPASTYPASTYPAQPAEPSGYPDQSAPQGGGYPPPTPPSYPAQPYPAQNYPAQNYPATPGSSYGSGGDPAGRLESAAPSSPPAPTSYAPTTYGRSRSTEDSEPAPTTPTGPPALPPAVPTTPAAASQADDGDTEDQAVERHDATRRVQRPGPPSWGSGGDSA